MPEHAPTATDRTALLEPYVTELGRLAKEQCPAAVVEVLLPDMKRKMRMSSCFCRKVPAKRTWINWEKS